MLPASFYLLFAISFLLPVTYFLFSASCFLLRSTLILLPHSCYLLLATCCRINSTCYLLPDNHYLLPVSCTNCTCARIRITSKCSEYSCTAGMASEFGGISFTAVLLGEQVSVQLSGVLQYSWQSKLVYSYQLYWQEYSWLPAAVPASCTTAGRADLPALPGI